MDAGQSHAGFCARNRVGTGCSVFRDVPGQWGKPLSQVPRTGCGAEGLGEWGQPQGPHVSEESSKGRRSRDGGEQVSGLMMRRKDPGGDRDPLGPPSWSLA